MPEWIGSALASVGQAAGPLKILSPLYNWAKDRWWNIKVELAEEDRHESSQRIRVISVYLTNGADKPVTVMKAGVRLTSGREIETDNEEDRMPQLLTQGSAPYRTYFYRRGETDVFPSEIEYGWAEDSSRRRYKSKKWLSKSTSAI
jgi:hypothetical protein